jgi:hypothetical protein
VTPNPEQSRAQLAETVDRLREQIADAAEDISPENIKAELSGLEALGPGDPTGGRFCP